MCLCSHAMCHTLSRYAFRKLAWTEWIIKEVSGRTGWRAGSYSGYDQMQMWKPSNSSSVNILEFFSGYAHEIIAVIIAFLAPDTDLKFIIPHGAGRLQKVLWQKLTLLVEPVMSPLGNHLNQCMVETRKKKHVHNQSEYGLNPSILRSIQLHRTCCDLL